eukprot:gene1623-2264_t
MGVEVIKVVEEAVDLAVGVRVVMEEGKAMVVLVAVGNAVEVAVTEVVRVEVVDRCL